MQGQILANLKAMDSDWFAQTYMKRQKKVSIKRSLDYMLDYTFSAINCLTEQDYLFEIPLQLISFSISTNIYVLKHLL